MKMNKNKIEIYAIMVMHLIILGLSFHSMPLMIEISSAYDSSNDVWYLWYGVLVGVAQLTILVYSLGIVTYAMKDYRLNEIKNE